MRKVWAEMAGLNLNEIEENSVLCSDHFEETCFDRSDIPVKLQENSVPTIFEVVFQLTINEYVL
jgi:hypothetical protein